MNHEAHKAHEAHEEERGGIDRCEVLARAVVDSAFKVHKALGAGLLESTYEICLAHELGLRGTAFQRQVFLPIIYEGLRIEGAYRLDMVVEDCIVVEIKSVEALTRLHSSQLLTYLKFSQHRIGFLINFNASLLKDGLKRLVLEPVN